MKNKFFNEFPQIVLSLMKMEGCWLIASIIPIILILFLNKDVSNIALFLLILLLMSPSLFVLIRISEKVNTEWETIHFWQLFKHFWPKYWREVLRICLPYLLILVILSVNLLYFTTASSSLLILLRVLFIIIAVVATLITINMMTISAFYTFPYKSLFKLSVYYLLTDFAATLKKIIVLIIAIASLFWVSNFLIFFLVSTIFYLFYRSSQQMLREIRKGYVDPSKKTVSN